MKKVEKGSKTELFSQMIATVIAGLVIWPLFDFILCVVFTHSDFKYSIIDHVVEPIIFGVVVGFAFWYTDKKKTGKKK